MAAVREREECASLGSVGSGSIAFASGPFAAPLAAAGAAAGAKAQGVWQDDAPVAQCGACDKPFNLARRKACVLGRTRARTTIVLYSV